MCVSTTMTSFRWRILGHGGMSHSLGYCPSTAEFSANGNLFASNETKKSTPVNSAIAVPSTSCGSAHWGSPRG